MTDGALADGTKNRLRKAIEELALILTPPSLAAILCQILDVNNKDTAVISLVVAVVIGLCVHRSLINQYISSALTAGIVVLLGTIFYFQYDTILMKDTGLLRWYKQSSEIQQEIGKATEASQSEIWFLATNFHITVEDRKTLLLETLSRGVDIHFLIIDPTSEYLKLAAQDSGENQNTLKMECVKSLATLKGLMDRWNEHKKQAKRPGHFEIRLFSGSPKSRIYIFDPNSEKGITIFVPYINKVSSPELPAYVLANTTKGAFQYYFNGVKKQWDDAVPFEEWLKRNASLLVGK